jgi:diguanylate cyclase (GGDEF)-like protein/PAS domain S-box-containing protein
MLTNGFGMLLLAKQITDRELRESEVRFRLAFENANIGVCLVDTQGNLLRVNRQMSAIFGYSQAELETMNVNDITRFEYKDVSPAFMQRAKTGEVEHDDFEKEYIHKKGQSVWGQVSSSLVRNTEGEPLYFISHVIDITERKQAENELRKLTLAVEQSPASIVIADLAGNIEYVNSRFTQVTGYSFDEAIGKNPRILKTDLTPPEMHQQLWDAITTGKEWHGEFVNRKKDGSLYPEAAIISPITNRNGVITHYLAVKEDITERKQAEEALKKRETLYRLLTENISDVIWIFDINANQLRYISPSVERLSGYTVEEALDATMNDMLPGTAFQSAQGVVESRLRAFQEGQRGTYVSEVEQPRKDGSTVWVEATVSYHVNEANGHFEVYGVSRDITERKQAEELLQKANGQLRADMEKIGQLQAELREQAIHDPLTGLFNRRYLNETLGRELARTERETDFLSIVMADIDHFKTVNDTYGHPVGDQLLVEVANLMKNNARASDIVCRYGGEEFLLVLPGTPLEAAAKRAEELRQKCAQIIIQHEEQALSVTMSFGVATYPAHGSEAEEIIIKADKALYQSKNAGRNRVTVWG